MRNSYKIEQIKQKAKHLGYSLPMTEWQALNIRGCGRKSVETLIQLGLVIPRPRELSTRALTCLRARGIHTKEEAKAAILNRFLKPGNPSNYGVKTHNEVCAWCGLPTKKTLKYKAWCALEYTDDLSKLPTLYPSKTECIECNTSFIGHPCDDPRRRGVIAECEVTVTIKGELKATKELRSYYEQRGAHPALLVAGDNAWNKKAFEEAFEEMRAKLRKLRHAS